MQALTEAIAGRAPYACLTDGYEFIFLRLRARLEGQKVVGWEYDYYVCHSCGGSPTAFQVMYYLLSKQDHPEANWPAMRHIQLYEHPGTPLAKSELDKSQKKTEVSKVDEGGSQAQAGSALGTDAMQLTTADIGGPVRHTHFQLRCFCCSC